MALNPNIILQGRGLDLVDTLDRSAVAGQRRREMDQQNALTQFMQQNGQAVLAGDQNALNNLAQFGQAGLQTAQATQSQRQGLEAGQLGMDATRQRMGHAEANQARLTREEMRAVQQQAAQMSAQERAAAAAETEQAVAAGMAARSPQQWDAMMAQVAPDLVGQFDNREMIAGKFMSVAEVLKRQDDLNAAPAPLSPEGKLATDMRAGIVTQDDLSKATAPDAKATQELRKEFNSLAPVKAFSEQSQAFGRIVASAKDPSPAGDLALIFNYMKVLDPGSVVRESEFATAAQAAAWLQQSEEVGITVPQPVAAAIRKMATGQRLAPAQRVDFVDRADALYSEAERGFEDLKGQYTGIAERNGYIVDDTIIDFRYNRQDETPPPGDAVGGPQIKFRDAETQSVFEKYSQ